jgi:hypothetical protein
MSPISFIFGVPAGERSTLLASIMAKTNVINAAIGTSQKIPGISPPYKEIWFTQARADIHQVLDSIVFNDWSQGYLVLNMIVLWYRHIHCRNKRDKITESPFLFRGPL